MLSELCRSSVEDHIRLIRKQSRYGLLSYNVLKCAKKQTDKWTIFINFVSCQIAWALNKGIKPEFKPYWNVELGVTYIPWSKIKEDQLEDLTEGGMLDADTVSPGKNLKFHYKSIG